MKEHAEYRIELDGQDIEEIIEQWAEQKLKEKGYTLDSSRNVSGESFPYMAYRGVKEG